MQAKLISYLAGQINYQDDSFQVRRFPLSRLCPDLGIKPREIKQVLKAFEGIMGKVFKGQTSRSREVPTGMVQLIGAVIWRPKTKALILHISPSALPQYKRLQKQTQNYPLKYALRLPSKSALSLYEYCLGKRGRKKPACTITVSIEQMKVILLKDSSEGWQDPKVYTRQVAAIREQVNRYSDIWIDIRYIQSKKNNPALTIYVKPNSRSDRSDMVALKQKSLNIPDLGKTEPGEADYKQRISELEQKIAHHTRFITQQDQQFDPIENDTYSDCQTRDRYQASKKELVDLKLDLMRAKIGLTEIQKKESDTI